MALLIFPHEQYLGNMYWNENEKPTQKTISKALNYFRTKGYFASSFPEGDGICFEHDYKNNTDFFKDFIDAFPDLDLQIYDTPENRKIQLEVNKTPIPKPGNFYYKLCDKKTIYNNDQEEIMITGPDVITGEMFTVTITRDQLDLIEKGFSFEIVLNHLPANEREFLISGVSSNQLFSEK